jgi:4-alpha-glucanotransferase
MNQRKGILLHLSSLPGEYGIGDLGYEAYQFADWLTANAYSCWQILPVYHTGYGNSPYNPISAFALNPCLVSPELLYEDGLVNLPDLNAAKLPRGTRIAYDSVIRSKHKLLEIAADNYIANNDITEYIESNALYLKPYMAYLSLARLYGDTNWQSFRPEHRRYSESLYRSLYGKFKRSMDQTAAGQVIINDQLQRFKAFLASRNLTLIGDMPLYLSYESSEVWANQDLFLLDGQGNRLQVAGVPPDAFSCDGQLWGNPLYRWDKMRETGFSLFQRRISHALEYLDLLRLDHFIGYVNYWSVPCEIDPRSGTPVLPATAMEGEWLKAEPETFFEAMTQSFDTKRFIAEDLGILNPEVCRIRDDNGFPGMIILQFCFEEGIPDVSSYPASRYLYTGTHDNPTLREWYEELSDDSPSQRNLLAFIRENPHLFDPALVSGPKLERNVHKLMMAIALSSGCGTVIFPLQDVLGYDSSARMNVPGTALGNWQWRLEDLSELDSGL